MHIRNASKSIFKFFVYVCQYMVVQIITFAVIYNVLNMHYGQKWEKMAYYIWDYTVYCPS